MKKSGSSKTNRRPLETDWIFWTFRNSGQNSGQKSTAQNKSTAEQKKALKTNGFQGFDGGDKRDRTADLLNAIQALSQLSYTPILYRLAADLINIADFPQKVKPYF